MELDSVTLRKLQMIELELLEEVDRICRKCHIHYNIIAGTLLGAFRHGDLSYGMMMRTWRCCGRSMESFARRVRRNWTSRGFISRIRGIRRGIGGGMGSCVGKIPCF